MRIIYTAFSPSKSNSIVMGEVPSPELLSDVPAHIDSGLSFGNASLQHENKVVHGPEIELHVSPEATLFAKGLDWNDAIVPFHPTEWDGSPLRFLRRLISKVTGNFSNVHLCFGRPQVKRQEYCWKGARLSRQMQALTSST